MSYSCDQEKMMGLAQRYARFPNDLGLFQGPGYNFPAPDPMCMNSAAAVYTAGLNAGRVSASLNPSSLLFQRGLQGLTLAAPNSAGCDKGCYSIRPDPRVDVTKGSLYTSHVYDGSKPNATNVMGQYP